MLHKAWNSKGEMPYCFPRSSIKFQGHTVQNITDFDPNWAFRIIGWWQLSNPSDLPCFRSCIKFQGHTGWKIDDLDKIWARLPGRSQLSNPQICLVQGHLPNFKVRRLKKSSNLTQIGRFWTLTPVWFHQWLWNDAQSLKWHRRGALLFFEVIRQISRSHG